MDTDNENGLFANDSDSSSTNSSLNSADTNQSEMSIRVHDEAIIPEDSEETPMKIVKPSSPIFVVNPHQWDDIVCNNNEPYINPKPYEITWVPTHTPSAKIPNPSHYLYNFFHDELDEFKPMDLFPTGNSDPSAVSSSRAHLWPTIEDYRAWMISEPDPKRRKQYQELALKNPTLLVDIYHAATTAPPDSPLLDQILSLLIYRNPWDMKNKQWQLNNR
ncbi:hypothetical protein MKW98_021996 [Papaver atlanticum]|uniref:Uncharacterized protein n=1 Tax=Papaver atlanticum TaxID=357466 RepID=A0AAD4SJG5_9MAGN|nr:hypothetical protein MKW98_021996 [Papaver atlanticum]